MTKRESKLFLPEVIVAISNNHETAPLNHTSVLSTGPIYPDLLAVNVASQATPNRRCSGSRFNLSRHSAPHQWTQYTPVTTRLQHTRLIQARKIMV